MTPAFVQSNQASISNSSVASISCAYTANVTAGNLLVAICGWYSASATTGETAADTLGDVWHEAAPPFFATTENMVILYATAASSGANTVTVTLPAGVGYAFLLVHELAGVDSVDQTTTGSGTGTAMATGSVTTTHADEILLAGFNMPSTSGSAGTGFTQAAFQNYQLSEYEIVSATGSYSATATTTASGNWEAVMATFYKSGAGPTPNPQIAAGFFAAL